MGDARTAKHVAVGLFDFSCKHCRHLNKVLKPIQAEFGDRLAIIKLPAYFNQNGQKIQQLLLPVFREEPELYEEIGNELYNEKLAARSDMVRAKLVEKLGAARLEAILAAHKNWANQRLNECQAIRRKNKEITKSGKLPQMIVGKAIEAGNNPNPGHYYHLFKENFGLTRDNVPQLTVSPSVIDLGRVVVASQHTLSVNLNNSGKLPVKIAGVSGPRGATIGSVPSELGPGKSATVKLNPEPCRREGGPGDDLCEREQ